MAKDQSRFSDKSQKARNLVTKLLQKNLRAAKRTLGLDLGPRMTAHLKVLGRDYGFSIEAGELQIINGNWYVTHTGLLRLARRYSAACKPLYIIFTGFWLLTDALYPYFAKLEAGAQAHRILLIALGGLAITASAAALGIGLLAPQILTVIYGSTLGAAGLFRILLIALPIDFCFSLLWTVMVSRGYERPVLYSFAAAAGVNVLLNLVFIPRFQANAAAWATVASYALLFLVLLTFVLSSKVLSRAFSYAAGRQSDPSLPQVLS